MLRKALQGLPRYIATTETSKHRVFQFMDAAAAEAYGWPSPLTDDDILTRLCALNTTRAAEEARGHIRWLRPEFQAAGTEDRPPACQRIEASSLNPSKKGGTPRSADSLEGYPPPAGAPPAALRSPPAKRPWPKTMAGQAAAVRAALTTLGTATDAASLAKTFKAAKTDRVEEMLETLASLGQARALEDGRYVAV